MDYTPSQRQFEILARSGLRVPVAVALPLEADARALFEAISFRSPKALLESARRHPVTGRYSLLVGEPAGLFIGREQENPLPGIGNLLRANRAVRPAGFPPFVGGAVGYFSYDLARLLEPLPSLARDDLRLPHTALLFCDEAVVADHLEGKVWAIALADPAAGADRAYDEAAAKVETLVRRLSRSPVRSSTGSPRADAWPTVRPELVEGRGLSSTHTRAAFEAMVRRAKEFIAAGEIYQANLSQRFSLSLRDDPWALYRRLRQINPSPFAAFADFGFLQVASASPERLLRVAGRQVETRPLAGTRPRGRNAAETAHLRRELLLSEKEQAEHLMLLDLERNDLGRVCGYGSVRVSEFMALEEYSHVIHIVSNVQGALRPSTGLEELLAAVFPGGTITGCPKIRCMKIIEELEPVRRHLYTGSLGYLSYSGEMDLNLLIRTAFVMDGQVHVQAGAGIVADSDPSREYEETLHKAQALLQAVSPVRPELAEERTDPVHATTGSA